MTRALRKGISHRKLFKRRLLVCYSSYQHELLPYYTEFIELQTSTKHISKPKTIDQCMPKMSVVHVAYHIF